MVKVLLCGGSGFFGKSLAPILKERCELFSVGSTDYNLLDFAQAETMFCNIQPNIVVHLAAKVGGILANRSYSADFWYQNMLLTAYIWELSKKYAIDKMIYVMPGCAYPKLASFPIKETSMWDGYPDEHPAPGALAKKMSLAAAYAYKVQYGLKSCIIVPGNMFGPNDSFDLYNCHVIPAMIVKMHEAKKNNTGELVLWGSSGRAVRDFVYVEDVAKCIPYFIDNEISFNGPIHLNNVCNISTGISCSIKELAEIITKVVGYTGRIIWDDSKLEGPLNKTFDNSRMKSLGLNCETSLREGIRKTYEWYLENKT